MKKILLSLLAMVALTASAGVHAVESEKVEEQRALKGFECIEQLGSLDVKYRQGNSFSVKVEAPKRVIKQVQTRVVGNKLVVSMKGRMINLGLNSGDEVTVYVTSPDLIGVELKGSGDFECKSHVDTDNLDIRLKGSGDIDFHDIICDRINICVEGSGDVEVKKVVAQESKMELIGSGDLKVNQQKVRQTSISLKGSGDVKVNCAACGQVNTSLVGSGDITLSGDVSGHQSQSRGSGDIDTQRLTIRKK